MENDPSNHPVSLFNFFPETRETSIPNLLGSIDLCEGSFGIREVGQDHHPAGGEQVQKPEPDSRTGRPISLSHISIKCPTCTNKKTLVWWEFYLHPRQTGTCNRCGVRMEIVC